MKNLYLERFIGEATMKRLFTVLALILILPAMAPAADIATPGTVVQYPPSGSPQEFTLPIVLTSDSGGGAVAATNIFANDHLRGAKLDEVEVVKGTSTASVTIKNSRGTIVWSLAALDATVNKLYPGFQNWGFNPKVDTQWTIETGALAASDTVTIYLKFTKRQ